MLRVRWVVVALGFALGPEVYAHQTPAVLGLAGPDASPNDLVRLSHGLAVNDGSGQYRFLCPAAWGGPERPVSAGGIVFGAAGVMRPMPEGGAALVGQIRGDPYAATSADGRVYVLARNAEAVLFRIDTSAVTEVYRSSDRWDGLAAVDDHVILAGPRAGGGLDLVTLSEAGLEIDRRTVTASLADSTVSLVAAGSLFVHARNASHVRIGRIDDDAVVWIAESPNALFGPAVRDGHTFVVRDGMLVEQVGDGWSVVDDTRRYTCLEDRIVCTLPALYGVDADGVQDEVFRFDQIRAPVFEAVDEAIGCRAQWIDVAAEAGLDFGPSIDAGMTTEPQSSCSCRSIASGSSAWALMLLVGWRRKGIAHR